MPFGPSWTPGRAAAIPSASEDIETEPLRIGRLSRDPRRRPVAPSSRRDHRRQRLEGQAIPRFSGDAAGLLALAWARPGGSLRGTDYFWRNPLDDAQFQNVTDFGGTEQAAAVSRDGRFVAFLSDRDGRMDVWVTQVGTGQFYNLTRGRVQELVNPSVRTLGFSPDGALVTFWARGAKSSERHATSASGPSPLSADSPGRTWKAWPSSTGPSDGSRLVYHTPGPGDPMFVRDPGQQPQASRSSRRRPGFTATFRSGRRTAPSSTSSRDRCPMPWTSGASGQPADAAERITHHNSRVSHPVLLNHRTLMYLASDRDGSGPWLHSLDVERRVPHRVSAGSRSLYLARGERRRSAPRRDARESKGNALAAAHRRHACRRVSSDPHLLDDGPWILASTGPRLSAVRLVEGHERRNLEARRRSGHRAVERAGRANHRRPRDRARRTSGRVLGRAARQDAAVRDER